MLHAGAAGYDGALQVGQRLVKSGVLLHIGGDMMREIGAVMELKKIGLEFTLARAASAHWMPGEDRLSEKQRTRTPRAVRRCWASVKSRRV